MKIKIYIFMISIFVCIFIFSLNNADAFRLKYQNVVRDGNGLVIKDATITAVKYGTSSSVNLYSSETATIPSSITSDSSGKYTIYFDALENGSDQDYTLTIAKSFATFTATNIRPAVVSGTHLVSSSVTVTNPITIPNGVILSCGTGTITFSHDFHAGTYQVFDSSCNDKISFVSNKYVREILPQWWGGLPGLGDSGATTVTAAINTALLSARGSSDKRDSIIPVKLSGGSYTYPFTINSPINMTYGDDLVGNYSGDSASGYGVSTYLKSATTYSGDRLINLSG